MWEISKSIPFTIVNNVGHTIKISMSQAVFVLDKNGNKKFMLVRGERVLKNNEQVGLKFDLNMPGEFDIVKDKKTLSSNSIDMDDFKEIHEKLEQQSESNLKKNIYVQDK